MTTPDNSIPDVVPVVQPVEAARYTDVSQFDYFRDRINWAYNNDCNVRFDTDGTTILFFYAYRIHLGDWLVDSQTPVTDAQMKLWFRPSNEWPTDNTGA